MLPVNETKLLLICSAWQDARSGLKIEQEFGTSTSERLNADVLYCYETMYEPKLKPFIELRKLPPL